MAVGEALASIAPARIAIVPRGPSATAIAAVGGGRGFETWRHRVVGGLVGDVVVDPGLFS